MRRSDRQFSRRGEAPTEFERTLLAQAASDPTTESVWLLLATRIGVDALAIVFDELAGEKIKVPTREGFIRSIYEPMRNARLIEMRALGTPTAELAVHFGLTPQGVNKILRNAKGPTVSGPCAKRPAP